MKYITSLRNTAKVIYKRARSAKVSVLMLLVLVGLPLAAVATVHAVTASNAHNRAVIAFIGDSNISLGGYWAVKDPTYGPVDLAPDHKDSNYIPTFIARAGSGIRTPDCMVAAGCTTNDFWKLKLAAAFTKIKPDAIVTELGINDANKVGTIDTPGYSNYGQKIDYFMKLIPAGKPVFWTNLPCQIEPASFQTGCASINYSLLMAKARWPNLSVINWAAVANGQPGYLLNSGPLAGVHYTDVGYKAWAQLVLNALDARFPVPAN